jgi:carbon-monoxide dehydrogenase large subunit
MGSGYVIPAIFMDVKGVFSNTVPIDAYRGAGKPEVNYMIERLIDEAARRCGFDAIELRRRNLVTEFPYRKALGTIIDCGRFAANLDDGIVAADRSGFAGRQNAAEQQGRLRGIGVTCFMETARGAPNEGAEISFEDNDRVALRVGTQSNGMGHETAYAQIAADLLGLPIEAFRYVQADTREVRAGNGHGGARSMQGRRYDAGEGNRDRRTAAAGIAGAGRLHRWPVHGSQRPRSRHRPAGRRACGA